jgi:hypothetical protein
LTSNRKLSLCLQRFETTYFPVNHHIGEEEEEEEEAVI